MLQAIQTKYLGPTNQLGARIKASCAAGSITVSWQYDLNPEPNHVQAAKALVKKLECPADMTGKLHGGQLRDGTYAFVMDGVNQ